MDSQELRTRESAEEALPSSSELQDRLAPTHAPVLENRSTVREQTPAKRRLRLGAPAWALLGALTLFGVAIAAKSNHRVPRTADRGYARSLVDRRLVPSVPNLAAQANLKKAVAHFTALNEQELAAVLQFQDSRAQLGPSQQRDLNRLLAKPELAKLIDDLDQPVYETPPQVGAEPRFPYPRLVMAPGIYARHQLLAGHKKEGERAYRILMSLYPRMEASRGGAAWLLAYSAASESVKNARTLWQDRSLTADQLQHILDAMQEPTSAVAEEDAVRYAVYNDLVNQLSDPAIVDNLLASFRVARAGGLDAPETFSLANRAGLEALRNLHVPWPNQDRTESNWLQSQTAEARLFAESRSPSFDWLANLAQRRRTTALKNLVGLTALTSAQFIITGQPSTMFQSRTAYEAARTMLGVTVYERRFGKPPRSLRELVHAGIFKELPTDPYSGHPFLYSSLYKQVWSVGPDGKTGTTGGDVIYYFNTE